MSLIVVKVQREVTQGQSMLIYDEHRTVFGQIPVDMALAKSMMEAGMPHKAYCFAEFNNDNGKLAISAFTDQSEDW